MSAWYVWSAMGLYPETPGTADLALGSPLFPQVAITPGATHTITVNAPAAADNAPYVQSPNLNGAAWSKAYLPASAVASAVASGATLDFTLGTAANTSWASAVSAAPPSYDGTATPFPAEASGPIDSGITGKCIDDAGFSTSNGSHIQLYTCNGTDAQNWTVVPDGTLQAFGKCVDVVQGGTANGTKVQLCVCNGTGSQQWQANSAGELVNPQSGLCLDDPGGTSTGKTQLQIYDRIGGTAQTWTLPH
jgi:hypothetical protein